MSVESAEGVGVEAVLMTVVLKACNSPLCHLETNLTNC